MVPRSEEDGEPREMDSGPSVSASTSRICDKPGSVLHG